MKKNEMKDQKQKGKQRRLSLSRETIQILKDPPLSGVVAAGGLAISRSGPTTEAGVDCGM